MGMLMILLATLFTAVVCEPPVQGYNYKPPSTSYGTPIQHRTNTYIPPSNHYSAPSSSYIPPSNHYSAPSSSYIPPSNHYNAPSTSYIPANNHFSAPSTNYNPPSNHYSAPSSSYIPTSNHQSAPSTNYGAPAAFSAPNNQYGAPAGNYDNHDHGHDNEVPKSYEFGYSVKDAQSGNDYDRKEVSDGNTVKGEYRVQLPDGRVQIVTYHADWQTGFHADVRYEGEAQYPDTPVSNAYLPPQTGHGSYNSAPSDFSGSLTGFHGNSNRPSDTYGSSYHH